MPPRFYPGKWLLANSNKVISVENIQFVDRMPKENVFYHVVSFGNSTPSLREDLATSQKWSGFQKISDGPIVINGVEYHEYSNGKCTGYKTCEQCLSIQNDSTENNSNSSDPFAKAEPHFTNKFSKCNTCKSELSKIITCPARVYIYKSKLMQVEGNNVTNFIFGFLRNHVHGKLRTNTQPAKMKAKLEEAIKSDPKVTAREFAKRPSVTGDSDLLIATANPEAINREIRKLKEKLFGQNSLNVVPTKVTELLAQHLEQLQSIKSDVLKEGVSDLSLEECFQFYLRDFEEEEEFFTMMFPLQSHVAATSGSPFNIDAAYDRTTKFNLYHLNIVTWSPILKKTVVVFRSSTFLTRKQTVLNKTIGYKAHTTTSTLTRWFVAWKLLYFRHNALFSRSRV